MKIIVNTCMAIIATASIIFVSTEAAASSPYQRKLSKKDKEHHNSANCPNSLYFSSGEFLTNIQYFIGPEPANTPKTCVEDGKILGSLVCTGDKTIINPTTGYSDMDLNDDVGFVSITATIVLIPNYIFVIDGAYGNESSGSIVFNDGSQIVFAGYYVAANLFTAGDLAITGGTGRFRGISGQIDFIQESEISPIFEIKFICD